MFLFLKNSFLGVLSVGCRLGSSFFLNKMVALYFGPAGMAQLAHFQNLVTFFTILPNDGINRGLIKYLASNDAHSSLFRRYLKNGFYLTLAVFFVITIILVIIRPLVLSYFPVHINWLILFLLGAFMLVLQSFFNAVLLARHKNGLLVLGNMVTALGVITFVGLVQAKLTLPYFLIGYLLVLSFLGLVTAPLSLTNLPKIKLFQPEISAEVWRHLSKFILMAASVLLFTKGLEYYIRDYLIRHFSIEEAGLWQGIVRISDSYTALYSAVLAFAFYPKVAAYVRSEPELKFFVQRTLLLLVPIVLSGLGLVYVTREHLITLLLSARFTAAQEFLPYQLAGDFCKLISWLLANILVAQAKFKVIFILEAISALFYLGCFYFYTNQYGVAGTPMAHSAHYILFLALNLFYFRNLLRA